jgi:hypothetical protein
VILHSSVTKTFEKNAETEGTYNEKIVTPTKTTEWLGWTLGESFEGTYFDDSQHTVGLRLVFIIQ